MTKGIFELLYSFKENYNIVKSDIALEIALQESSSTLLIKSQIVRNKH